MKKRAVFIFPIIFGLFILLGSWTPARASDVVKIGVLGPFTGGAAVVGVDMLRGVQLGAKEVNDRGGVNVKGKKYKVEVVSMDDGAVVANSVANARRMVSLHKTPVVIGPPLSSCALAVMEFNEKKPNDFLIMTMAMHNDITNRGNKLVLRVNTPTKIVGEELANNVIKLKKPQSVAIIHHTDDWGLLWKDGLTEGCNKNKVKVTATEGIDERKQTDFYVQLTKIVETKPEAVFMIAHDAVTAMMVKQIREIGFKGRLVFSEGFGEEGRKLVAGKLEGSIWPTTPVDFNTPSVQRYREMFTKLFPNETMKFYGPHAYDEFRLIIAAMEKAQSVTDPYAIRAAMPEVTSKPIPAGILLLSPVENNGHINARYLIAEQKGDKVIQVGE